MQKHLQELRESGRWETLGEVVQHLKHQVITSKQPAGWRVADIQPLDYYGAREVDLGFPASRQQSTVIKSATLRLVEGGTEPNPFWRLQFAIEVHGLGEDGKETKEYHLSQNLHTADELAAQVRGTEAIESLADDLKRLSTSYPTLRWIHNAHDYDSPATAAGHLALSLPDGASLSDPEPQNLFHLVEDMPNPKVNFRVIHRLTPSQNAGKSILTLSVQRGTESEDDLIDFKNRSGKIMCRSFEIDAGDPSAVEALVAAINSTFRTDIEDAYGNRTEDGKRKTRQEFRTATVENLFNKAVDQKIGTASEKRPEREEQSTKIAVGA